MPVSSQVIRFDKSTGANGTTQDVAVNFTPKAIILMSDGGAGTDDIPEAQFQLCIGFSDGTNHAATGIGSEDNAAASDAGRIHSNADVFIRLSETAPTTTVVCRGSCVFQTNNVQFTWTVNDAVATKITMWAFGGDDIIGVKVNTVNVNETVDGNTEDYTGLGFTPQGDGHTALFFMSTNDTANSSSAPSTHALSQFSCTSATRSLGVDSGKQWSICVLSENAADPSDTWRTQSADRNHAIFDTAGAFHHYGIMSAWISDGFRMTWDNAPVGGTQKFSYLVIDGGNWDSGTLIAPTSAGNDVDYSVSVSSKPIRGLMCSSTTVIASAAVSANSMYTYGFTDGTTYAVMTSIDEDAQATMDSYRYHNTNPSNYIFLPIHANGNFPDLGHFDSFGTDSFRLDYSAKSANAQLVGWVVVADQTDAAAAVVEAISNKSFGALGVTNTYSTQTIFGASSQ
jgi:hypothetical protein